MNSLFETSLGLNTNPLDVPFFPAQARKISSSLGMSLCTIIVWHPSCPCRYDPSASAPSWVSTAQTCFSAFFVLDYIGRIYW